MRFCLGFALSLWTQTVECCKIYQSLPFRTGAQEAAPFYLSGMAALASKPRSGTITEDANGADGPGGDAPRSSLGSLRASGGVTHSIPGPAPS